MAQAKRKDFAHFFNVSKAEEDFVLEGIGVESLGFSYNPQIDTFKQIIDDVANSTFDGYQIQGSVASKRIDRTDKIWEFLNEARKKSEAIETSLLEVDMASDKEQTGTYEAIKYNVLLVITEFLGESATISYDMYIKGTPEVGTATIAGGKPTFVKAI